MRKPSLRKWKAWERQKVRELSSARIAKRWELVGLTNYDLEADQGSQGKIERTGSEEPRLAGLGTRRLIREIKGTLNQLGLTNLVWVPEHSEVVDKIKEQRRASENRLVNPE